MVISKLRDESHCQYRTKPELAISLFNVYTNKVQSRAQIPPSHGERGLVTIERFLSCAESADLILNNPMK